MTAAAVDLFGEPARTAELSQFFTPMWLARRAMRWIPPSARILEPSAGRGNLIDGWLRAAGPEAERRVTAVEKDPRFYELLRRRFPRAHLYCGDFLEWLPTSGRWDAAPMNPPYEGGQDASHVAHALELVDRVVAIVKSDFEYSAARDRVLWSRARVVRRALIVDRPDFGETMEKDAEGPTRNYVVLQIVPAAQVGGAYDVREERWRRADPEARW
jgi:predicted RNA methylase